MAQTLRARIDSDMSLVAEVGANVRSLLALNGVADSDSMSVELCVVEAVNNVIEHGYRGAAAQPVEVSACLEGMQLTVEVRDQGMSLDPARLAKASVLSFDPADVSSLPERGMGLYIIQSVMDGIEYKRVGTTNVFTMHKTLSRSSEPSR